jgi:hypothetical protein
MNREDLRALYSDVMKTLHDEAFCEGFYNPEEADYAIKQVKTLLEKLKRELDPIRVSENLTR